MSLEKEVLTITDVAEILGLRASTVSDYARRGILPSFKIGRHRRFRRSDIQKWLVECSRVNPYR